MITILIVIAIMILLLLLLLLMVNVNSPCALTEHHAEAYWRSGGIAPRILDLGTRWR
jgi:hypothetical protein